MGKKLVSDKCQTLLWIAILNSDWILVKLPYNLLAVALMFPLGFNLELETSDLCVQTSGCPSNLQLF